MLDVAWESFAERRNFCRVGRVTNQYCPTGVFGVTRCSIRHINLNQMIV
jgi:hypothetical protein